MTDGRIFAETEKRTAHKAEYGVISMIMYYGVMTASKALGMDSSNNMYYLMFGISCLLLLYKYCVTEYTLKEIAMDIALAFAGIICFAISRDMTVMLLAMTVIGLKGCSFKEMINTAFYIRLSLTSIMIICSLLGIFDQGETAQVTTSFQDITVYSFGYSTPNNAYINMFLLIVLFLYINYEKINLRYFVGTSLAAVLMYTFTNSRTGMLLFFAVWILIFCDKFLTARKARYVFFSLISFSTLICAVFSYFATAMFNPDGGYWSIYINRIFSGRLNITHKYHEALSMSLLPRSKAVMDAHRGFGFIDNSYMSVYFHDGLLIAIFLIVLICVANRRLFKAKRYKELVFIAVFSVYAMMEEFPLNPIVNPFIMLVAAAVYGSVFVTGSSQQTAVMAGNSGYVFAAGSAGVSGKAAAGFKKTVLLVHNRYKIAGGEDTVAANEKKMLEEHGHRVIVYERSNMELEDFSKLRKLMLPFTSIFSIRSYRQVKRLIEENDVDIVHVHNTLSLVSPSVYYAAFKCGVPVVQTMHNFRLICPGGSFYRDGFVQAEAAAEGGESSEGAESAESNDRFGQICEECAAKGLGCAVKHSCYRKSRVQTIVSAAILKIHRVLGTYRKINFICLTKFNKYKLLQLNDLGKIINPARVFIKPNFTYDLHDRLSGADKQESKDSAEKSCKENGYYVFVGRLEKLKGIELLTDAFIRMPNRQVYIMGDGVLEQEIKEKCRKHNAGNIKFMGRTKGSEYAGTLAKAKALIVTSQCYETFGMSAAEAYSLGVPVIAGDIGNIGDIVIEGKTGLHFRYNSVDALIDTIDKFEQLGKDDIEKMRENALRYYRENLTEEQNYKILTDIYDRVSSFE